MNSYRGRDRRGTLAASSPLAAPLTTMVAVGLAALFAARSETLLATELELGVALHLASAGLLAVLAVAAWSRWRWFGDARAAHLAVGCVALTTALVLGAVVGPVMPRWTAQLTYSLIVSATGVAVVAVVLGLRSAEVDTGLRARTLVAGGALGLVGSTLLLLPVSGTWTETAIAVPVAVVLIAAGGYAVDRSRRLRAPMVTWIGAGLVVIATGEIASLLTGAAVTTGILAEVVGLAVCAVGAMLALRSSLNASEARAVSAWRANLAVRDEQRSAAKKAQDRAHELRNALLAIEGATAVIVSRSRDEHGNLDDLSRAVSDELARLRRMIDPVDDAPPPEATFDLRAVIEQQVLLGATLGWPVVASLPPGEIEVIGHPEELAEIVQNLLGNAAVHAFGTGPIELSVVREGVHVDITVADRGPGIPRSIRGELLRGPVPSEHGAGIGLHLCADLAITRGAVLTVEDREGGGAIARLQMRAASLHALHRDDEVLADVERIA